MAADLDKNQIVPALDDVRACIRNKSYEEALTAIKSLTGTFHEVLYLSGSEEDAYLVFDEEFERVLHELRSGDEFRVITADIPFTETASLCAEILMDLDRPDEARSVLRTGLRRAPESFRLTAEYADTFRRPGELEEFFRFTLEAFRTAFRSRDVARCFRNLGYYFKEKGLPGEASACWYLSLQFEENSPEARSELALIRGRNGGKAVPPSMEQIKEYAGKYGFPIGADPEVLGLSSLLGKQLLKEGKPREAGYFLGIAYDLTKDDDIRRLIESLPSSKGPCGSPRHTPRRRSASRG